MYKWNPNRSCIDLRQSLQENMAVTATQLWRSHPHLWGHPSSCCLKYCAIWLLTIQLSLTSHVLPQQTL